MSSSVSNRAGVFAPAFYVKLGGESNETQTDKLQNPGAASAEV